MSDPSPDKRGEDSADATARMLPCPSCGETDVDATFAAGTKGGEREERFYNAGCMVCGMTGPDSHTPRDAADRWNALPRTTPSHEQRITASGVQQADALPAVHQGQETKAPGLSVPSPLLRSQEKS